MYTTQYISYDMINISYNNWHNKFTHEYKKYEIREVNLFQHLNLNLHIIFKVRMSFCKDKVVLINQNDIYPITQLTKFLVNVQHMYMIIKIIHYCKIESITKINI
jgi:hypothetical protein